MRYAQKFILSKTKMLMDCISQCNVILESIMIQILLENFMIEKSNQGILLFSILLLHIQTSHIPNSMVFYEIQNILGKLETNVIRNNIFKLRFHFTFASARVNRFIIEVK